MLEEVPEDRCGYVSDDSVPEHLGGICCWRPVWRDKDTCIWHCSASEKTSTEIIEFQEDIGERLDGADFAEKDLSSDLLLEGCILYDVNFSNTNLNDAVFTEVYIEDAEMLGIEAEGITINSSNIKECDLSDGNLRESEFLKTDITDSDFSNGILQGGYFKNVRFIKNLFVESNMHGSVWEESFIDNSNISNSKMSCFVMMDGIFSDNKVVDSELTGAVFKQSTVGENDFSNSKLVVMELEDSNAWENEFKRANLREVILSESQLGECNFMFADITEGDFSQSNILNSNFSNSMMNGADFTESNARGATFNGANLEDATFIRTELRDANLKHTRLYQTLFADTRINSNTDFGEKSTYEDPDTDLGENYDGTTNWEAAAWVYRRLQDLHEENAMSEQAREYHIRKEEAHRSDYWAKGQYFQWFVYTLNRYLTRHGESLKHVVAWSIGTILVCALAYPFAGGISSGNEVFRFGSGAALGGLFLRSLYFSTVTFTTLGYGDYHPVGPAAKALAGAESLAGALLVALFVFVLGRRVAR